ncbi:MAG: UvrD-helicase domain-containing protein [Nitrospira sp.]|nr:UvrD-helicase domain-containing protein [Nitrospira sp.]
MPLTSLAILSCAGSGKTTEIVGMSSGASTGRSLLVTYTRNNTEEIRAKFYAKFGFIPHGCDVDTWFSFLLTHFVRPYQRQFRSERIGQMAWHNGVSTTGIAKTDPNYYFTPKGSIYRDKVSAFGVEANAKSRGKVVNRLKQIYSTIYIDEFQDLAGWDFEIVELLLRSGIQVVLVGDHRQHTFKTNDSTRFKKYAGEGVLKLIEMWKSQGLCEIEDRTKNHRGCQAICDLADYIFPHTSRMTSGLSVSTAHDGVFQIKSKHVDAYCALFHPQILRWDVRTTCGGRAAMNFGASKGLGFDRVLIFPNGSISKFLEKNDMTAIASAKAKLYVGVTRARYSVTFVLDKACAVPGIAPFEP